MVLGNEKYHYEMHVKNLYGWGLQSFLYFATLSALIAIRR